MIMKKKHLLFFLLPVLFALLGVVSCGDDNDHIRYGRKTDPTPIPSPSETASSARMEAPVSRTDGSTILLTHYTTTSTGRQVMTYCLEYDKEKLHSRWVAFRFDGDTRARNVSRTDAWSDDPDLPSQYYIGTNGFGWTYNRGHLCASADRLYSYDANAQTFYMTNMSPMIGSFNQGYWVTLEGQVQKLGRDASFADTLYVVKGGTIADGQTLGVVERQNGKQVAVPKYYFMALLKLKNGVYSSIAFWMEHKEVSYGYDHQAPLSEIEGDAVSVNRLEELTGINFFPNLPDALEESVEAQNLPANWGF